MSVTSSEFKWSCFSASSYVEFFVSKYNFYSSLFVSSQVYLIYLSSNPVAKMDMYAQEKF